MWMEGVDTATPADDAFVHGYSANHDWQLSERGEDYLDIAIDYPDAHPVRCLRRRIRRAARGELEITLEITMRRDARLPIGLHPVLALPERPGDAKLVVASATSVRTFPIEVEPGVSVLEPDVTSAALNAVPGKDGGDRDLSSLPLSEPTEELVLVALDEGRVALENRGDAYRTVLTWDIDVFPQCLLWLSNGGRRGYPWNGRFRALGVEPAAAPFDLGQRHADNARSPLGGKVCRISTRLSAGAPLRTSYRMAVEELWPPYAP